MADKIQYNDLVAEWITEWEKDLKKMVDTYKATVKQLQKEAKVAQKALSNDKSVKANSTAMKAASKVIKEYTDADKQLIAAEKQLKVAQSDKLKIIEQTRSQTNQLKKETREQIQLENSEVGSIQRLKLANRELNKEREKLNLTTRQGKQRYKELTASMKQNEAQLKKFDKAIGRSQRNVGNYVSAFRGLLGALGITAGAYGLIQGLKAVTGLWIGFEKEMSKVRAITGATGKEFKQLTELALYLGKTTQFTASEVAQLEVEYSKLGFTTQQIIAASEATLDLALATGTDLANAASVTAGVLNSYNAEAKDTGKFLDVMAKGFTSTALDIDKFKVAMANVGAAANASGFSIESTTALLGTLVDANIDASKAGTDLRTIFISLAKRGITLDEALEMINGSQDKLTTSVDLFQKRAAVSGIVLANNIDKIEKLTTANNNAKGSLETMAGVMEKNVAGSIKELQSAWQGLILSFRNNTGVLNSVVTGLKDLVNWVSFNIDLYGNLGKEADKSTVKWSELRKEATKSGKEWRDVGKLQIETSEKLINTLKKQREQEGLTDRGIDVLDKKIAAIQEEIDITKELIKVEGELTPEQKEEAALVEAEKEAEKKIELAKKVAAEEKRIREENATSVIEGLLKEKAFRDQMNDDLVTSKKEMNEIIKDANDEFFEESLAEMEADQEIENELNDEFLNNELKRIEIEKQAVIDAEKAKQEIKQKSFQLANELGELFVQLSNNRLQTEINDLESQKQYELDLHGNTEQSKEAINTKFDAKIREAKKKQAQNEKKLAILQAVVNTASSVTKALNNPPPLSFILAALTGALGVVQIAKIASTKIPEFAEGTEFVERGKNRKGRDTIPALLNEGERIIDADTNELIGNVSNKDIPSYIEAGKLMFQYGNIPAHAFNYDMKELKDAQEKTLKEQKRTNDLLRRGKFYNPHTDMVEGLEGNEIAYR